MLSLVRMTREQIQKYAPIWGEFTNFNNTFYFDTSQGPGRTFGFYGTLVVKEDGEIALSELLVACSCEHETHEMIKEIQELKHRIFGGKWKIERHNAHHIEGSWEEFRLILFSEGTQDQTIATHLLLAYGETERHLDSYLRTYFILRSDFPKDPAQARQHYYPVGTNYSPEKARSFDVNGLVDNLRGKPIVAFTGAGISLSSGIPTFVGPGGLDRHFPLHEQFPGAVAGWMIKRPHELARILGQFQACFITAQPNAAHLALAELERKGILRHLITGNSDRLHERAGSQRVHLKQPHYFTKSGEGWNWIREGKAFLVVGVSRDEHGFLSYARDQGIQVVVIAPERPSFLYAEDWFVEGKAEEILPELAEKLPALW